MIVVMTKRVALYLRVSTTEQTVENQQRELEAVAERHGWNVVAVFTDAGISGSKGRNKRPGYDCLCRGIARREFDQVAAWSVDRSDARCRSWSRSSVSYMRKTSICICISRASTPAPQPERRCFRCSASLLSSSTGLSWSGSRLAFHVRGARGSGSGVAQYPGKLSIASARSWRLARESSIRPKDLASAPERCIG
jgi:hypothetical protein